MNTARHWIWAALVAGMAYLVIGRVFAWPATHVQRWRVAAWLASGVVFAAHIWYEHARGRGAPRVTALHAAVGVAIGACALAVAGALYSVLNGAGFRPNWLIALVAWPAFTAIPAFVAAYVAAALLSRVSNPGAARETR